MGQLRAYFAAVMMADGRVLAAGGKDDLGMNLNSTEVRIIDVLASPDFAPFLHFQIPPPPPKNHAWVP